MPVIPNLPTDNLYKFLALAGLTLLVIAAYVTYVNQSKYEKRRTEQLILISELQGKLGEMRTADSLSGTDTAKLHRIWTPRKDEFMAILIKFDSNTKLYMIEGAEYGVSSRYTNLMWVIGSIFTLSGFGLWWWKHQRYLDRDIKKDRGIA